MNEPWVVAATGHRPDKLGGYGDQTRLILTGFARKFLDATGPDCVISGMAQGWDQAVAQACVDLGIHFGAAIPFIGQQSVWPPQAQKRFEALVKKATWVHIICEPWQVEDGGFAWALQERNKWMVDRAGTMMALWNGTPGGTANCLHYAEKKKLNILNGWPGFASYRESGEWLI